MPPDERVASEPCRLGTWAPSARAPPVGLRPVPSTTRAVMPDAPSRPQFPELLEEGFEPYEIPHLWLVAEEPDTYVDITKTIDLKLEALTKHRSQNLGDSFTWVRKRAKEL